MTDDVTAGASLSRAYFHRVVAPILSTSFPGLRYSAGRLGAGSDVLGLDDAMSRDHDWGLRLSLFIAPSAVEEVSAELERRLPDSFGGLPTRFAFTGEETPRHHVDVGTVAKFTQARLGFDPRNGLSVIDWLSLSGQAVLEVVAGPVFVDHGGELASVRSALTWYPDDLWRYVIACDWARLAQELPSMSRAGDVGDDMGSRIIAARLAQVVMHLAFLLERRWPPYAKWFGSAFRDLACAADLGPLLGDAIDAVEPATRQHAFSMALDRLLQQQNGLGLTRLSRATIPFWDRPHVHPDPAIVPQLLEPISDPEVRALPPGRGSIEQLTNNADVLMDPQARRRGVAGCPPRRNGTTARDSDPNGGDGGN